MELMSDDYEELKCAADIMAAQLIEIVKRMNLDHFRMPMVDTACVWEVTIEKMGIHKSGK